MTEQRFDIIVTDKVDGSINSKLAGIGTSATSASAAVKDLNRELAQNSASSASAAANAATKAAAATARVQAETAKAAVAQARLSAEQDKASAAAEKLAQAQAKTATAQAQAATAAARAEAAQSKANKAYLDEESALNRATAAEQRAINSKKSLSDAADKAAAAQKRTIDVVMPGSNPSYPQREAGYIPGAKSAAASAAANDALGLGAAAAATGTAAKEVEQEVEQMATTTAPLFTRFKTGASGAFDSIRDFVSGNGSRFRGAAEDVAKGAGTAAEGVEKLATKAHLSSTAVRELLVIAREGGRGDFTRMAGSVSILASATGALGVVLPVAAVGFGALFLAHKAFNDDVAKSQLKDYAGTLGLTDKEMRKLSDTHLTAKGTLHEVNLEQVTYGDTLKGFWKTLTENQQVNTFWATFSANARKELDALMDKIQQLIVGTYALAVGTRNALNEFTKTSKEWANTPITQLATHDPFEGMGDRIKKGYTDAFTSAGNSMKGFYAEWRKNSIQAAKERLQAEANAIRLNRNPPKPRKGPKAWDREGNLEEDNTKLDQQIAALDQYGQALTEVNMLEEISKKYREHNVPLNEAETKSLRDKIHAYEDGKRVQAQMTAQEEAANGPQRKYYDTMDALDKLLGKGAITSQQYAAGVNMAARAFEDATDPLASLNRELQRNAEIVGKYGRNRDVATYIQSLAQAAEAKGQSIYQPGAGTTTGPNGEIVVSGRSRRLTTQAQGMVDEYQRQQVEADHTSAFAAIDPKEKQRDPTSSNYLLRNYKSMYAEIQKLRDGDVAHEAEAAEKKKNLDRAVADAKLSSVADALGQIATLSSSKNKEIAAIGKAAAVAQATIDGYAAVQKALASAPPPFNYVLATAVGVATAANVAKIAGVGFQSGGYTGDGSVDQVAGPAHRGEYVFDAAATRRIGVPALDAMRGGGNMLSKPASGGGMGGPRVSIYPQPGVVMEEVGTSDDHIEMIASRTVRNQAPKAVADNLRAGSNSHMGKAMRSSYGIARSDR